ncbi:serine hydrolase domain-containing protein [Acinetobacter sp.]|uniref:serine hydrolase domain-containing protein n=2 Tax=Acinetobacter sp. TaxID=472 RepID=UPI002FC642EF
MDIQNLKQLIFADTGNFQGYIDERFIDLAHLFSRLHDARTAYGGAALAVYFQGRKAVDIYTGQKSQDEQWQADTLSICYSAGKGVLATLAHIMVSHGILDYDLPIAHYWPEFAQNGKAQMTLRHLLSHQSGLYDVRNNIAEASEMADWQHMLEVMAKAKPRFSFGEDLAYQPLTFGWLVGGVLEKASSQPLAVLMQRYLIEPLALDGAYFGVPDAQLRRVARLLPKPQSGSAPSANTKKAARKASPLDKLMEFSGQNPQDYQDAMIPKGMKKFSFFSDEGIQAVIPAANGAFTANSLARIYAMLANHGVWNNQVIISPEVFAQLSAVQSRKRDRIMPIPMHWRLGYHRVLSLGKSSQGFGHIGFNGSGAWCDPARQLSFAYTHNFAAASMIGDYRLWSLTQEALRCADAVLKGRKGWF